MNNRILFFSFLTVFLFSSCSNKDSYSKIENLPEIVDFNFHIKPILSDRCFLCHGPDPSSRKANLRLDEEKLAYIILDSLNYNYLIKQGHARKSELFKSISSKNKEKIMPPPESNLSLSDYEIALIKKWINQD